MRKGEQWQRPYRLSSSSGWQLGPVIVRSHSIQSSSCEESEPRQPAPSLLSEMRVAYTPISACEKCEQRQPAMSLLSDMRKLKLEPAIIRCVIPCGVRDKREQWQPAHSLLSDVGGDAGGGGRRDGCSTLAGRGPCGVLSDRHVGRGHGQPRDSSPTAQWSLPHTYQVSGPVFLAFTPLPLQPVTLFTAAALPRRILWCPGPSHCC